MTTKTEKMPLQASRIARTYTGPKKEETTTGFVNDAKSFVNPLEPKWLRNIYLYIYPPPCLQARLGVFGPPALFSNFLMF